MQNHSLTNLPPPRNAENGKKGKKIYWTSLPSDSLPLGNAQNMSNFLISGQRSIQQFNYRTVLCLIVQWLDSALSNSPIVWQWCVQLSNCQSLLYPTVQWSVTAGSNSLMVGQMLCPTVQWYDIAVSNCPMVGLCCVQLSNGWTVLCLIVLYLED